MVTDDPIVDAHQHFWTPAPRAYAWLAREPASIRRPFGFDDLAPLLRAHRVTGTVLVQADDTDADTEAMFAVAAAHPEILGIVGYLPLAEPERAVARLAELRARGGLVGIRTLIHDQPDPDWLLQARVAEGLALLEREHLPFDLVAVLPRHLEHVGYLSERFPDLTIVIDHLSKPPVGTDRREPWHQLMRAAATNPRVVAKVSGLYPAAGGSVEGEPGRPAPLVRRGPGAVRSRAADGRQRLAGEHRRRRLRPRLRWARRPGRRLRRAGQPEPARPDGGGHLRLVARTMITPPVPTDTMIATLAEVGAAAAITVPEFIHRPIAVVGAGAIMDVAHLSAYRAAGLAVVGVLDVDLDRARQVAERHGIPRVYRDLTELLGDPEPVVVDIAVPAARQPEIVEAGPARGPTCARPEAVRP